MDRVTNDSMDVDADSTPIKSPQPEHGVAIRRWSADICLIATALMWGINMPLAKLALAQLDAWTFNGVRLTFAVATLAVLAGMERRIVGWKTALWHGWNWRVWLFAVFTGLVYQWFFILGIDQTSASNFAILLATMPIWTAMLSAAFLRERLGALTWGGLAIAFAGAVVVITAKGNFELAGGYLWGNLFAVLAAICWASGTVVSRDLLRQYTPLQLVLIAGLLTTPFHLLMCWRQLPTEWSTLMQPRVLAITVYSGVFSTGIAYLTWNLGVRILGGSHAAIFQNLVTVVAVLGSWFILSDAPAASQIIGGLLVIAGIIIMRQTRSS